MKAFQLNDCDVWAGEDLESVKSAYLKATGMDTEEAFDDPCELTPEELAARVMVLDEDGKTEITLAAQLAKMIADGETFPTLLCSTEY